MTRPMLLSLMSVLVLWGMAASASTKKLDYYHRTAVFESSHDVCGGTATLVFERNRAVLLTDFTRCSFLTLRHDGVIWRQSVIEREYQLELNRLYVGRFTVTPSGVAGDSVEVDTAAAVVLPPPPPPLPPVFGRTFEHRVEVWPGRTAVIPVCGGQAFIRFLNFRTELVLEGVGQCQMVQAKSRNYEPLSGLEPLVERAPYNYYRALDAGKWGRSEVVYELSSSGGRRGVEIVVHVR